MDALPAGYLTVPDIASRWRCGARFVRRAIVEMEGAGYLERFFVGRGVRVSPASVQRWENQHTLPPGTERTPTVRARSASIRSAALRSSAPGAIRNAWRQRRAA